MSTEEQPIQKSSIIEKKAAIKKTFADIGYWIKHIFDVDLDGIYKTPENEKEEKKIRNIRLFNLIEFLITLLGVFGLMWTLWWQGIIHDDLSMMNLSFSLIGIIGVWGIIFSPFVHYIVEKGITYRPGYLGLNYEQNFWTAWFEERGFGSLMKHWKVTLKDPKMVKIVNFMTLYVILTIVLLFCDRMGMVRDIAKLFGITDALLVNYATVTSLSWLYQAVTLLLAIYGTFLAGQWKDTGDKDGLKKFLLIVPQLGIAFTGIFFMWGFGINYSSTGAWAVNSNWADTATMYQTTVNNTSSLLFVLGMFGIFILTWFLIKYVVIGILIRFDNLKTSAFQLVFVIALATLVIFGVWGILATPSLQDYILSHNTDFMSAVPYNERLWYIFDSTAMDSLNEFNPADFFANWGFYVYWGLVQEWLFLGYWCTLLTKVSKNKYVNALLSSACFGLIHYPSWPLMIFTIFGGFFWAMAWQRNDSRNIFIMGAIHGFAGTMVAKFIPITMSVGPSNMM